MNINQVMEVDNDIDGLLLQTFSRMGTQDRDVLISRFQAVLGNDISPETCAFYLDMSNWNLQAAIGSYYDYEQNITQLKVPCAAFVKDVTIGEGEAIPPNTSFRKTWRVKNSGSETWPPGCSLHFIQGSLFGANERVMVDALQPGEEATITISMTSPSVVGMHQSQWRLQTPTGLYFGEVIWVILNVEEHGLMGLTQQMSSIATAEFAPPNNLQESQMNPFSSPIKSTSQSVICENKPEMSLCVASLEGQENTQSSEMDAS